MICSDKLKYNGLAEASRIPGAGLLRQPGFFSVQAGICIVNEE